jgi:hypothetical protein
MTESEVDCMVGRLVPEFEITKFAAIDARERFFALTAGECVHRAAAYEAQRRWLRLEATCDAILRRIDDLAERGAA